MNTDPIADFLTRIRNSSGSFLRIPQFAEVPYPVKMDPQLIIEWYSRRV